MKNLRKPTKSDQQIAIKSYQSINNGEIEFIKVGKHRRINIEDVYKYKLKMKESQKQRIIEMMNFDEEIGLYDI